MRYDNKIKQIIPNVPCKIDAEKYSIVEMKRMIVLDLINKLPFEVNERQLSYGTEYTVSIDVNIEEWCEYSKRIAPFLDEDIEYRKNEIDNDDALND